MHVFPLERDGPTNQRTDKASYRVASPRLKMELAIFENTGERPAILEKVFCAIKTLPPTSVEAERAFSAAGMFVTKLRSRLSEKTINALIS